MAKDELAVGMPLDAARAALNLPTRDLIAALVTPHPTPASAAAATAAAQGRAGTVIIDGGYLRIVAEPGSALGKPDAAERARPAQPEASGAAAAPSVPSAPAASLPPRVASAVQTVLNDLAAAPFAAPDGERLRELGLDARALAAAARAGLLLRIADLIVLAPGADKEAARVLTGLPQPFTTSQARQALATSRRVAIPLLEYLDRARVTERLPGDLRRLRPR
jgi:Elongation factor SelB, winged helix